MSKWIEDELEHQSSLRRGVISLYDVNRDIKLEERLSKFLDSSFQMSMDLEMILARADAGIDVSLPSE